MKPFTSHLHITACAALFTTIACLPGAATAAASLDKALSIPMTWDERASFFTVELQVADKKIKLMVDTGSSNQVITESTASLLGLDPAKLPVVGTGKDHAGNPVPIKMLPVLQATLAGQDMDLKTVVIIPDIPDLARLGVAGMISPQLAFDHPMRLDFRQKQWIVNPVSSPFPLDKTITAYWFKKNKVFTQITAEGKQAVWGMIDSGAGSSKFEADYLGRALSEEDCAVRGVAGCGKGQKDTTPTRLDFGGTKFTLPEVVLLKAVKHGDKADEKAQIGMSILRFCSITINKRLDEQISIACVTQ
ncbi:aspartyl protease family protein [Undibacterium pigrum]|uniref:Aspartyl protease n=1 Tax=Undibacterium pigrum TaxID=401470 RepID=A0A318IW43_9BURK|nr:aspartyl protease family protein [Undibacterium pigrum]PXX38571.1 aspartyl protease [Undibacterium pigrum]